MKSASTGVPKRRRGGQELPDSVQDRLEQNAGYDEAVRGKGRGTPVEPRDDAEVIDLERSTRDRDLDVESDEFEEVEETDDSDDADDGDIESEEG
jgi:hypothetical protein